jgi:hypothetical protein
VGLTTLTGLYLGGRWQSGLFDDVFAATFFLLGTVLVGAAIVTADVLPRWRDNRMLLLHGALPVGLGRQAAIVLGLSLVVVAGVAAALLAGLGAFTSVSAGLSLDLAVALAPGLVLGWGMGGLAGALAGSRVKGLLIALGGSLGMLLATRSMMGPILDLLGVGAIARFNPLQPVHAAAIDAASGWGAGLAWLPLVLGVIFAAVSVPLTQAKGVPR